MAQNEQGGRDTQTQDSRQRRQNLSPRSGTAAGNIPRPAGVQTIAPAPDMLSRQLSDLTNSISGVARSFEVASGKKERQERLAKAAKAERRAEINNLADTQAEVMLVQAQMNPESNIFFDEDEEGIQDLATTFMQDKSGTEFDSALIAYANEAGFELDDEDLVNYRRRVMARAGQQLATMEVNRKREVLNSRITEFESNYLDSLSSTTAIPHEEFTEARESLETLLMERGDPPAAIKTKLREFEGKIEQQLVSNVALDIQFNLSGLEKDPAAIQLELERLESFEGIDPQARKRIHAQLNTSLAQAQHTVKMEGRSEAAFERSEEDRLERETTQADMDEIKAVQADLDARFRSAADNRQFEMVGSVLRDMETAANRYKEEYPDVYRSMMNDRDAIINQTVNIGMQRAAAWHTQSLVDPSVAFTVKKDTVIKLQTLVNALPDGAAVNLQNSINRILATEMDEPRQLDGSRLITDSMKGIMSDDPTTRQESLVTLQEAIKTGFGNLFNQAEAIKELFSSLKEVPSPAGYQRWLDSAWVLLTSARSANADPNTSFGSFSPEIQAAQEVIQSVGFSATQLIFPTLSQIDMTGEDGFVSSVLAAGAALHDTETRPVLSRHPEFNNEVNNYNSVTGQNFYDDYRKEVTKQLGGEHGVQNFGLRLAGSFVPGRLGRNPYDYITYGNVANREVQPTDAFLGFAHGLIGKEVMKLVTSKEFSLSSMDADGLSDLVSKARRTVETRLQENVFQYRGPNNEYIVDFAGPDMPLEVRQAFGVGLAAMNPAPGLTEPNSLRATRELVTTLYELQQQQSVAEANTPVPRVTSRMTGTITPESFTKWIHTRGRSNLHLRRRHIESVVSPYHTIPMPGLSGKDRWMFSIGQQEVEFNVGELLQTLHYQYLVNKDRNYTTNRFLTRLNAVVHQQLYELQIGSRKSIPSFSNYVEFLETMTPEEFETYTVNVDSFDDAWTILGDDEGTSTRRRETLLRRQRGE